jgi:ubiquinone/menaquinone biosynthesis C-methylase UbiE
MTSAETPIVNHWTNAEHALAYLSRADAVPHRTEGEATLLELVPRDARRILDLGTGNGRLLALLKIDRPHAETVALDFSPAMLAAARERFAGDPHVTLVEHNMDHSLPGLGTFDAIVSSFAIHHCVDARKRGIYAEAFELLVPGGVFCNLEHVASPTFELHVQFTAALGITPETEDPSNKLLDLETQLAWLRQIGFTHVDCFWKWRELALIAGWKPTV